MTDGKPLLLLDIDGVFSLFGFAFDKPPAGSWHGIDGVLHFLSSTTAGHLQRLGEWFEPIWCSGWEEKASEHLPALLGVPVLPHLTFARNPGKARAHWKLDAIDAYAGAERPVAWVDDALDDACEAWAAQRARHAPTLLLHTLPAVGLTDEGVDALIAWAAGLAPAAAPPRA